MITTEKLMTAIKRRVVIWTLNDVYTTKQEALKIAAKLFVTDTGVIVRQTGPKTYMVLSWHPGFNV